MHSISANYTEQNVRSKALAIVTIKNIFDMFKVRSEMLIIHYIYIIMFILRGMYTVDYTIKCYLADENGNYLTLKTFKLHMLTFKISTMGNTFK